MKPKRTMEMTEKGIFIPMGKLLTLLEKVEVGSPFFNEFEKLLAENVKGDTLEETEGPAFDLIFKMKGQRANKKSWDLGIPIPYQGDGCADNEIINDYGNGKKELVSVDKKTGKQTFIRTL